MGEDEGAMRSPQPVIEMCALSKLYRTDTVLTYALQKTDMRLNQGEYVALMGRSGSGKTTLLAILALLDEPSAGEYLLAGQRTAGLSQDQRARVRNAHIGFVFQSFNLIGDISVKDNVELPLIYRRGIPPAQRHKKVQGLLEAMGMAHRARHFPAQLSGGEAQRVAIARALVTDPQLILADEPTGNLDTASALIVMDLLETAHREMGATVLVATHDRQYAARAQRIIQMVDGKVVNETRGREGAFGDANGGPPISAVEA